MTLTTRRRPAVTVGLAAVVALATLTGCAQEEPTNDEVSSSTEASTPPEDSATSSAPDDSAATSTEPDDEAAGDEPTALASADGSFEVEIPAKWEDALDLLDDETILLAAKDTERVDEFYTNVVVTQEEYAKNLTEAVEDTAKELAGEDGEYELLDPADVDGNKAPGYTLVREVEGAEIHQTQRWISHDGTLYVVTFSAVASQAKDAAPVLDDILASWTWKD